MPSLSKRPGSSSAKARQTLVIAGLNRDLDVADIRKLAGGSLRKLSAQACSDLITRLSGRGLVNPPGKKPPTYRGRSAPGVVRMITSDHVEQITRLMSEYFGGDAHRAAAWLQKNFKVSTPQQLATAEAAGEVIRVLKQMLRRRKEAPSQCPKHA